jgi:hypothetical protein
LKNLELKRSNIAIYVLSGLNEPPLSPRRILNDQLLEKHPALQTRFFVGAFLDPDPLTRNSTDNDNSVTAHNTITGTLEQQQERKQQENRQHNRDASKSTGACKGSEASDSMQGGNYSRDAINIKDDSSIQDNRNNMYVTSSRTAIISRKASNMQQEY